jgi:hypothetical protein
VTRLQTGQPGISYFDSQQVKISLSCAKCPDCFCLVLIFFPGVELSEHDADRTPLSRAEVKNV